LIHLVSTGGRGDSSLATIRMEPMGGQPRIVSQRIGFAVPRDANAMGPRSSWSFVMVTEHFSARAFSSVHPALPLVERFHSGHFLCIQETIEFPRVLTSPSNFARFCFKRNFLPFPRCSDVLSDSVAPFSFPSSPAFS